MSSKSVPEISIVSTYHAEGIIAHKTILSLIKCAKRLERENISYEFIVNLDNPDTATLEYFKRWRNDSRFRIYEVSFGNPSDNRNDAIKKARGTYISLHDGDDIISEKWLLSSYKMMKKITKPVVLRPAVHAQFGYEENNVSLWFMRDSSSKEIDAIQMSYWNLWTNALFSTKATLVETPYIVPENGFGYEDYKFNADLRMKNVLQKIVPETILWYRRRVNSVSSHHADAILGYSKLFSPSFIKTLPMQRIREEERANLAQKAKSLAKKSYRFAFDSAKKIPSINRTISPLARDILYKKRLRHLPDWLIEEWKCANELENQLWPTKGDVAKVQFHPLSLDPYHSFFGRIYQELCIAMSGDHLDYLFLAPAMSGRGGTEKLISNYIKALQTKHPSWRIGILSTQPYNAATLDYFKPLNVDMLDFGRLTAGIGEYEKNILWSRLLVHSRVKRLHLVNDAYWYHWIARQQSFIIQNGYKIYISLFMQEFTHEKNRVLSFADPDLLQIWPTVTKVFTDNKRVIGDALKNNAFDENKLITHYQPQESSSTIEPKDIRPEAPIRVLWASRISHQKRPDILKKVANGLGDEYIVDAYGIIEKKQYKRDFFNKSKVNYKGSFNGISSLPTDKYDIYLYTSQTDGVPNILMEISAAGLPIVASDIGGVSEFIHNKETGLLVAMDDIEGYIAAIKSLATAPTLAKKYVKNAQELMKTQHSWDIFTDNVNSDIE